jgi:hypothetical protein
MPMLLLPVVEADWESALSRKVSVSVLTLTLVLLLGPVLVPVLAVLRGGGGGGGGGGGLLALSSS